MPRLLALIVIPLALSVAQPQAAPGSGEWKYDVVHRKKGVPLKGLILDQGARSVTIRCISRQPGSATVLITEIVPLAEIARLELLGKDDRALLQKRLAQLKADRDRLTARLEALGPGGKATDRSDALQFDQAPWPLDKKVKALRYRSTYFTLTANASPELVELVAIHLEQVFAAYARALPPRRPKAERTSILVTRSLAEYQALAKARGLNLLNPAFYDPENDQVVCGSDLERLRDERAKIVKHHDKLRADIKARRADLMKLYRNKVPAELLAPMAAAEKRIVDVEKKNDATFRTSQQRLFRRLYHEAFHAYVGAHVYSAKEGALPLWLNEGLAQIFETAILEAGELRLRHVSPERYKALRAARKGKQFLALTDLLRSQPRQFQVAHASEKQISDQYYLAAWAVAFHLTFEKKLLDSEKLTAYVLSLNRGTAPLAAFRELVGVPLPEYEKQLLGYLDRLREDGQPAMAR